MLAKYAIRTKIIAVVAFLLVAMTGMGLLAVRNMRAINANTVEISTSWLPSVRVLGDLRASVITYRNVIREHMLSQTLEEKLAMEKTLATVVEGNNKIRATYEPMISSPAERALYSEWVKLWESYKKGTEEVMALSRKAPGQVPREAHELNTRTVNKIGLEADAVLKKDIELNDAGADKAAANAADSYASALMMLATILGMAVIIGIAVSYYLVRDVSAGIASIVTPMQALGKGDLTADVPHQGERTEIGVMADTLQVFKDALIAKKAADEAAAADAEAKIERGRRVDGITRNFENVIGEIVQTVSSASTQLEASAGSLSATAERAREVTATVASASEEASANVQSVASATEELSSSVTEISQQIAGIQGATQESVSAIKEISGTIERLAEISSAIAAAVEEQGAATQEISRNVQQAARGTQQVSSNVTDVQRGAGETGAASSQVLSAAQSLSGDSKRLRLEVGKFLESVRAA